MVWRYGTEPDLDAEGPAAQLCAQHYRERFWAKHTQGRLLCLQAAGQLRIPGQKVLRGRGTEHLRPGRGPGHHPPADAPDGGQYTLPYIEGVTAHVKSRTGVLEALLGLEDRTLIGWRLPLPSFSKCVQGVSQNLNGQSLLAMHSLAGQQGLVGLPEESRCQQP